MTFIFGGHREAQHAADAGSLNVSKRVILAPAVQSNALLSDVGRSMGDNLTAPHGSGINMGNGVNLLNFNRLVAQAMLVGLNAKAEGTAAGLANAGTCFAFVEGSGTSIGAQLKNLLTDNSDGNWAATYYNEVEGNILKMFGGAGAPIYQASDFQVSYMNQRASDFSATNIDMSKYDPGNGEYQSHYLPITDYENPASRENLPTNAFAKRSGDNRSYMEGYSAMTIGSLNFYGVPTNPGMQPHLESNSVFAQQLDQPGSGAVFLPPNAFRIGGQSAASATQTATGQNATETAHVVSVSAIGTPQTPFSMQIPGGFIVVDNSATQSFSGASPNTDNVAANELGTGILVDKSTGYFSYGSHPNGKGNAIEQWQAYDHDPDNFEESKNDPPYDNIYDSAGKALKDAAAAAKIPYIPHPSQQNPPSTLCTDNNSSSPGGDPLCEQLAKSPPGGLSPFDTALHPNSLSSNGGQMSTNLTTASELAQCKVIDLYGPTPHGGGPAMDYNFSFGPTGIRFYQGGLPTPSNQYPWLGSSGQGFGQVGAGITPNASTNSNPCQVTVDGTIGQLFGQVAGGPNATVTKGGNAAGVEAFLRQRMLEINPKATEAEILDVLNTKVGLGNTYYIYLKNGKLVMDTQGPGYVSALSNVARIADGDVHSVSSSFSILQGVANPHYSYGIHDRLFTTWGTNEDRNDFQGDITATETASFQPSSGAFGLLGIVKFEETSAANGSLGFNNRD